MTSTTVEPIVKSITVRVPQERAFEVFTAGMDRWWNREYSIGAQPLETVVLEPHEGGRWFERDADGGECDWGRVLAWEPPSRVVLTWQVSAEWTYDPTLATELEIRFTPVDDGATEVRLEHRGLEQYGEAAASMRAQLDDPTGWAGLLERLAEATVPAA